MLDLILQRLKVKSIDELKPEEKATWMRWTAVVIWRRQNRVGGIKKIDEIKRL